MINYPSFGIRTISGVDFARKATGANWWEVSGKTCVGAWQAKGAASQAASYTNLANPGTYDLTEVVAPTWNVGTGWTFNGTTERLSTGIVPAVNQTWSMICRIANTIANVQYQQAMGEWDGTAANRITLSPNFGGDFHLYFNSASINLSGRVTTGVMAVAGRECYLNGSADGTLGVSSGATINSILIGNADAGGSRGYYGDVLAAAVYSDILTAGQVATLSAAIAAL